MSFRTPTPARAFTLIELLVVISIIALLIGILLPALGAARGTARSIASLSNLRQVGIGLAAYTTERKGYYPMHSSSGSTSSVPTPTGTTKPRWPDYLQIYVPSTDVFLSPNLTELELSSTFGRFFFHPFSSTPAEQAARASITPVAITPAAPAIAPVHGGYGYNFQYLGNARFSPTIHTRASSITAPSETVAVGDTTGALGSIGSAVYAIDPPLAGFFSGGPLDGMRRSHPDNTRAYYAGGSGEENTGPGYDPEFEYSLRSAPALRNQGDVAGLTFTDGHAESMTRAQVDDSNSDGQADNGLWNGKGDPNGL